MSSLQNSDTSSYTIQVINTYSTPVTCVVWLKSTSGGPTPAPSLMIPSNAIQSPGAGDTAFVIITYPNPQGGPPLTVNLPYGAPIDMTRPINALWNTGPTSQIIVIVETNVGED